jgi:DNA-binding LacI/PurR family transcriptional regulator
VGAEAVNCGHRLQRPDGHRIPSALKDAGWIVPRDVSIIGFDNIVDSVLVEPHVTTIAAPLISLGSSAVWHLLQRSRQQPGQADEPVVLPARLVIRGSTGVRQS